MYLGSYRPLVLESDVFYPGMEKQCNINNKMLPTSNNNTATMTYIKYI